MSQPFLKDQISQIAHTLSTPLAMRRLGVPAQHLILPAALLCGLGWAYAKTLAPSITWANYGADSGDLVTAAATMGVPHASGYPTYVLLARLFMLLPLGDLALRANLLSAVAGLLAVLLLYLLVRRLAGIHTPISAPAAGLAALALGLAPLFWSQAIIAEVYALNAALCAAILWFIVVPARSRTALLLQGLTVGLALGNHLTIALFAVAWLASVAYTSVLISWRLGGSDLIERTDQKQTMESSLQAGPAKASTPVVRLLSDLSIRAFGMALAGAGAGLLVYLYMPLRAAAEPPINWGGAYTWAGFWWMVSGALYRPLAFGVPFEQVGARLADWANLLVQQFGVAGLIVGCIGLLYGAPRARRLVWASAALAVAQALFALGYNTSDAEVYLLPALLIFALWIGLGVVAVFEMLPSGMRWAAPLVVGALAASLIWQIPATWRSVDASHDTRAIDYAAQVLAAAPAQAIVLSSSDRDSFALWYAHFAQGRRPDATLIVEPLLGFEWYRANLRAVYPDLHLPDAPQGDWQTTLANANQSRPAVCRTADQAPTVACIAPGR